MLLEDDPEALHAALGIAIELAHLEAADDLVEPRLSPVTSIPGRSGSANGSRCAPT